MMAPPTPCTARARLSMSGRGRQPADQRGDREDDQADGEDLAPPVDVAGHARGEQEGGQRQRVGVDDPLQVGEARVQRLLDVGQRHVHDRDVEQEHEGRRADGDQGPPFAVESGHSRSVSTWRSPLVQCGVIVGSALTIEIGDRTLLSDASFVVGAGEKVGLVGRNGTGKSSFISVLVGETSPQLRHRGNVRLLGSFGYLPQAPVPGGLGLEPTGFSHILSARGLDVLDDALGTARGAMADDPSTENIELFTDLQEQFQSNGGYEAESVMARLADGLGLRQELLLEDIDSLSGGQRRRVDLMRVLFQEPELMILDEPTNHLDRSAKRWLLDELARFNGALLVVSHDLKLLDQSITKVLNIANQHLTEWKGNYSKFEAAAARPTSRSASARPSSRRARSSGSRRWPTPCGRAPRSGPARPSSWTGGSSGWRGPGPRSRSGTGRASSRSRRRPAPAASRSRWPSWASATAATRCCRR